MEGRGIVAVCACLGSGSGLGNGGKATAAVKAVGDVAALQQAAA